MVDDWIREGRKRFGNVVAAEPGRRHQADRRRRCARAACCTCCPTWISAATRSVFVPFYGVPAATVPSLSRFARLGRAKVVPIVSKLTPNGYEIEVLPAWQDFPSEDVMADTALMNERLQGYIDTMPSQYYWVHRRFKTRPDGAAPVY